LCPPTPPTHAQVGQLCTEKNNTTKKKIVVAVCRSKTKKNYPLAEMKNVFGIFVGFSFSPIFLFCFYSASETLLTFSPLYAEADFGLLFVHLQYGTMKRQRPICVGLFQRNITSGKLTKTYSRPYIFLKIKVQTLLFGTVFTKLANITKLK
jgi:hypothetical protein